MTAPDISIVPDEAAVLRSPLQELWGLCEVHLRRSGGFVPFGAIFRRNGELEVMLEVSLESPEVVSGPASRELTLAKLRQLSPFLDGEVVAVVRDVRTTFTDGAQSDAVFIHIESDPVAGDVLAPYACRPGEVEWTGVRWAPTKLLFAWTQAVCRTERGSR